MIRIFVHGSLLNPEFVLIFKFIKWTNYSKRFRTLAATKGADLLISFLSKAPHIACTHAQVEQSSGAIWGSVSGPRTLHHAAKPPTFWLLDDSLYLLSHSRPTCTEEHIVFQAISFLCFGCKKFVIFTPSFMCLCLNQFWLSSSQLDTLFSAPLAK